MSSSSASASSNQHAQLTTSESLSPSTGSSGSYNASATNAKSFKSHVSMDFSTIKEIKILEHKPVSVRATGDKWKHVVAAFGADRVLIIYHGNQFVLSTLVLACKKIKFSELFCDFLYNLYNAYIFKCGIFYFLQSVFWFFQLTHLKFAAGGGKD